jgi:hypothetical protein
MDPSSSTHITANQTLWTMSLHLPNESVDVAFKAWDAVGFVIAPYQHDTIFRVWSAIYKLRTSVPGTTVIDKADMLGNMRLRKVWRDQKYLLLPLRGIFATSLQASRSLQVNDEVTLSSESVYTAAAAAR